MEVREEITQRIELYQKEIKKYEKEREAAKNLESEIHKKITVEHSYGMINLYRGKLEELRYVIQLLNKQDGSEFECIEVKNYDKEHRYGTDWVTEYRCKSNINLEVKETIEKLKALGHYVCGEITQTYNDETEELILKTVMY